jgi:hypothetical protein
MRKSIIPRVFKWEIHYKDASGFIDLYTKLNDVEYPTAEIALIEGIKKIERHEARNTGEFIDIQVTFVRPWRTFLPDHVDLGYLAKIDYKTFFSPQSETIVRKSRNVKIFRVKNEKSD